MFAHPHKLLYCLHCVASLTMRDEVTKMLKDQQRDSI